MLSICRRSISGFPTLEPLNVADFGANVTSRFVPTTMNSRGYEDVFISLDNGLQLFLLRLIVTSVMSALYCCSSLFRLFLRCQNAVSCCQLALNSVPIILFSYLAFIIAFLMFLCCWQLSQNQPCLILMGSPGPRRPLRNALSYIPLLSEWQRMIKHIRHAFALLLTCFGEKRKRDLRRAKVESACYAWSHVLLPLIQYQIEISEPGMEQYSQAVA